jgi:hypothetical protein
MHFFGAGFKRGLNDSLRDDELFYSLKETWLVVGKYTKSGKYPWSHISGGYWPPAPQTHAPKLFHNQLIMVQ